MKLRLLVLSILILSGVLCFAQGGELRFVIRGDPRTLHPLQGAEESSETIIYLTRGTLVRMNRVTQELTPELATSWKVIDGGRKITFALREGVVFSDGTPFTAEDVVHTFSILMDPKTESPVADSFKSDKGSPTAQATGKYGVAIAFPAPVASPERLFDNLAMMSSRSPQAEKAVLGPFVLQEYKAGAYLLLRRNERYWKKDEQGRPLPRLDSIRLEIQANRDIEALRFHRGELHMMYNLDADTFERLAAESGSTARDLGPSLEGEQMWFNQVAAAPLPAYKKAWFRSTNFRRAVSEAINRHDLARVVYQNHASPGIGPFSTANKFWFNANLKPHPFDPAGSLRRLEKDGFQKAGETLRDREGRPVELSVITNAGNKSRERIAAMIQQDLKQVGIRLNIVTLDFPSIIERITRTYDYESCLLGLINVDLDPSAQMNVWPSSGSNHTWNPAQKSPETPWEAEIDRLMQVQASELDPKKRKVAFDRVQEIVWEQAPLLYLVNKNALVAVSPRLRNVQPAVIRPNLYWNAEWLVLAPDGKKK